MKKTAAPGLRGRTTAKAAISREPSPKAPSNGADAPRDVGGPAFSIVGVGASAGGLEALEQFFRNMPTPCDAAFVIVQHLEPNHRGMLVELLSRMTALEVHEATDGVRVEREHVYVIPPGKDMSLLHGSLHLLPQASGRGRAMSIDFFFRSLAHDQAERSIGVVLSGMGTDGTLGLRAIRETGGAAFAQAPETARFDSMPRAAIDAGLADIVAPADQLPSRILAYRKHVPIDGSLDFRVAQEQGVLEKIFVLLRDHSGNDFSAYKRSTLYRRIERRMGLQQIDTFASYLRFMRDNPVEVERLFNELLIGVTSFFRDPAEWDRLRQDVLPTLVSARAPTGILRAWVAGCSTGEEAYSLAIVLKEALEPVRQLKNVAIQIFATDLDRAAIEHARVGLYPENIAADLTPERLRRFFVREDGGYRVSKEIRECVVFAPQNAIMDPPFTKLDILTCRNLLIYLGPDIQKRLIPLFHYCLNSGGVLFLGTAETVGPYSQLFAPLDGRTRLYRRLDHTVASGFPADFHFNSFGRALAARGRDELTSQSRGPVTIETLVDHLLVQHHSPLGVLCTAKGDVLYVSGRANKYLELAVGKANLSIVAMAREELRFEVSNALAKAARTDKPVVTSGLPITTPDGIALTDLTVQRLTAPKELEGTLLVVFADSPAPVVEKRRKAAKSAKKAPPGAAAQHDLDRARSEVQTIREEMQSSQEELKSTNEELQSTNEELQSTNEELTTSKEEMQSLNEELQTVNHELQMKVELLSRSNNDMKNLLNSTDIATLFLDGELRVRRFTNATSQIIKLIPADTGRPVTDIASDLVYDDLADDARDVLRTLVFKEKQTATRDGRAYMVRIMPYRTLDNVIDGVVITFTETTAVRTLEQAAQEQASQLRQMTESLPTLVWGARADGAFDYISRQWVEHTGVPDAEQLLWGWLEQVHPADRERVREEWRNSVRAGTRFDSEFRLRGSNGAFVWFKTRATPIRDAAGAVVKWYGTSTDIDQLKRAEDRLDAVLDAMSDACIGVDKDLVIKTVNAAAESWLGRRSQDLVGATLFDAIPEVSGREAEITRADRNLDLVVGGRRVSLQVRSDQEGGHWLLLHERAPS